MVFFGPFRRTSTGYSSIVMFWRGATIFHTLFHVYIQILFEIKGPSQKVVYKYSRREYRCLRDNLFRVIWFAYYLEFVV